MDDIAYANAGSGPARAVSSFRFSRSLASGPVTPGALGITCAMAVCALTSICAGQIRIGPLHNPVPLVCGALAFDLIARLMPGSRIAERARTCIYSILYLVFASLVGILFAYAGQRLGMPLQDAFFARADRAMGVDWGAFTHWVDGYPILVKALGFSYATMAIQIAAVATVLSFGYDRRALQAYLLAYALALAATVVVAALLPALSPIATLDRSTYHLLEFAGASPLEHLAALRAPGTAIIQGDLGGIISFPSFHATVAVMSVLALRHSRVALAILLPLNSLMLCATVTHGAHYACDTLAGAAVAVTALAMAARLVGRRAAKTRPAREVEMGSFLLVPCEAPAG